MKKKMISIMIASLLLAGLGNSIFAAETDAPNYTSGTPWLCIDLEGVVTEDTSVNLKDNFALYVNKDKILSLEIPEGYSSFGTFMDVAMKQAEDVKNMFLGDAPEGHDALLAYHLFELMMDWDSRNGLGVQPLKELTDAVESIDSIDALTAYFLEVPIEEQVGCLWGSGPTIDQADSNRYILGISSCGLLLDDSSEYSKLTDYGAIKKEASSDLARKMLVKLGYSEDEALQKIENCLAFESMFAPVVYTNEEQRRADYDRRIYNLYTRQQVEEAQGKLPILQTMKKMGFPEADVYMVTNPAFLERMNELYTEENLPLIRDYFIVNRVVNAASILDRECYEWKNDCSNKINGATGILDDETAFSSQVSEMLEWPVAQLYTETYLKQEDKDRISDMVDEILAAYHGILEEADFLSDETRAKAIEKLEAIDPRILYPDSWEKYNCEGLEIVSLAEGGTLWQASMDIKLYNIKKMLKDYSEPVDKEKWILPPQTVNCFYYLLDNSISLMGAYAQGSIYNSDMGDEELYAMIGTTIGHEISHAFDRNGSQYDKDGNMSNWWTEEDHEIFVERNAKMEAYYNAMHPWEGQDFYGSIMTGEACADMAGMKVVLRIVAEKEDFDYDAFFRAYANLWLTRDSLQKVYRRINDNHPMQYLRINATLQQFDEFLDFYDITEGDGMYLAPEDRVSIW